jgi:hypothetical protein
MTKIQKSKPVCFSGLILGALPQPVESLKIMGLE